MILVRLAVRKLRQTRTPLTNYTGTAVVVVFPSSSFDCNLLGDLLGFELLQLYIIPSNYLESKIAKTALFSRGSLRTVYISLALG